MCLLQGKEMNAETDEKEDLGSRKDIMSWVH